MKGREMNLIVPFLLLIIVSGCSSPNNEEVMSEINEAIEQNHTLENVTYEKKVEMEEEEWAQESEGIFIALDNNEYNWTHKENLGSENHFLQIVEIDGEQHELYSVDEENFEAKWQPVTDQSYELINRIRPLLENIVNEEFIESVEVTEEDGKSFVLHFSDAYTEYFVSEVVQDLENNIRELEEAQDDTGYIQALETQIEMIEEREYSNPENEIVINDEGYLVQFIERYTFTNSESDPTTITSIYEITDYNLENVSELLPEI